MIKVFKMISGEELISKVTDRTDVGYVLDSPAVIMMQQTETGVGVGIAPYMPYATGDVTLYASAIASEGTPDVKMENEYNRIFGSGIQVVSAF
jgi:hypothetical protein